MLTPLVRTLCLCTLLALSPVAAGGTLHVDAGLGSGLDDGSSWADAFQGSAGLQAALAAAASGDEIFVAQGSYRTTSTGSRTAAFALKNGVSIFGSFLGGESDPGERPPFGSADSVLDGDLGGNDGSGQFNDNSYHLITTVGTNASAVIDGFVVRAGAATTGGGNRDRGAGILCLNNASPTVRNCRFVANRCNFGGAAGYINGGAAPSFSDCSFEDGNGGSYGGAFDIAGGGSVRYERCLFVGNTAARAGALEIFSTNGVVVNNCVFRDNTATGSGGGGAIWMGNGGNTKVRGCTIVENNSPVNNVGGLRNQGASNATVVNCIFWNNVGPGGNQNPANQVNAATDVNYSLVQGGFGGGGVGNIDGDPLFGDQAAGDFSLSGSSPVIDAGDTTAMPAGTLMDFAGQPRLADAPGVIDTGIGPAPVIDMGAYELPSSVWQDLGHSLAGGPGTPALIMSGPLTGGSQVDLALSDALPSSAAFLVVGFSLLEAPLKGGVLVPSADLLVTLSTTPAGTLGFSFAWPTGVPAGLPTYIQVWIQDPAGPKGFSASNGVVGTTP
ncbi:MAG: hypothetical protein DRQ55_04850 [Planctomycetota bacterium]|nr:MAG: hypothetical protein DRQ55_04850 [Planctomycetota bacterium]